MNVNLIKNLHKELSWDIEFITIKSSLYYDSKRIKGLTLKKRDLVYLLWKNIKIKRLSLKLDHMKLGPFKILKVLSPLIYRLELPPNIWIHLVFYISLLELASRNAKSTHTQLSDET
jgi:hypothetical protein